EASVLLEDRDELEQVGILQLRGTLQPLEPGRGVPAPGRQPLDGHHGTVGEHRPPGRAEDAASHPVLEPKPSEVRLSQHDRLGAGFRICQRHDFHSRAHYNLWSPQSTRYNMMYP